MLHNVMRTGISPATSRAPPFRRFTPVAPRRLLTSREQQESKATTKWSGRAVAADRAAKLGSRRNGTGRCDVYVFPKRTAGRHPTIATV